MTFTKIAMALLMASVAFAADLDFATYRSRVEPIFLKKRPGHARCITCHEVNAITSGASIFAITSCRSKFVPR
jgi:hypothetical protein